MKKCEWIYPKKSFTRSTFNGEGVYLLNTLKGVNLKLSFHTLAWVQMLYKFPWHNLLKTWLYFCQNITELHPFNHEFWQNGRLWRKILRKNVLLHPPELELEVPLFVSNWSVFRNTGTDNLKTFYGRKFFRTFVS